jgi:hypothetical protein
MSEDGDQRIRERAYELWEADGCPHGRAQEYWYRAQAELDESRSGSLDEQLDESFPASDPPSMTNPSDNILPKAPEDEPAPARSATVEERPAAKAKPAAPAKPAAAAKPAPAAKPAAEAKPVAAKPAAAKPAKPKA